ncbi:MAG: hypothetical protein HS116_03795 [Planctomycetes bacterium]|nr:hypothetical protein [Planctomycetota bacterium]
MDQQPTKRFQLGLWELMMVVQGTSMSFLALVWYFERVNPTGSWAGRYFACALMVIYLSVVPYFAFLRKRNIAGRKEYTLMFLCMNWGLLLVLILLAVAEFEHVNHWNQYSPRRP